MKQFFVTWIAEINYLMYLTGIRKNKIKIYSMEETIEELIHSNKSLVRFGDGEIEIIRGRNLKLQDTNSELAESLARILSFEYEEMMVAIPNIFQDLSIYRKASQRFWKKHLLFDRRIYRKYCNTDKKYYNAFVPRFYYMFEEKNKCGIWVESIKKIWEHKDIVIVEGEKTLNGVGNDLFAEAGSIERIIGPSNNAFDKLAEIEMYCKEYPIDKLFLLSLGAAAKILAERLFLAGYRVLDIGNLDMEYEWYLQRAEGKIKLAKYDDVTVTQNEDAGYMKYLEQIKVRIKN